MRGGKLCTNMRAEDVTSTIELALQASGCDQTVVRHKPRLLSDHGSCYISGDLDTWVGLLIAQLQQPEGMLEAKEALRGLIDRIVLTPDPATCRLSLDLEGALSRLLWLAVEAEGGVERKNPAGAGCEVSDIVEELVLVAGACNRRNLPRLRCMT
jgi:hypothetical protein